MLPCGGGPHGLQPPPGIHSPRGVVFSLSFFWMMHPDASLPCQALHASSPFACVPQLGYLHTRRSEKGVSVRVTCARMCWLGSISHRRAHCLIGLDKGACVLNVCCARVTFVHACYLGSNKSLVCTPVNSFSMFGWLPLFGVLWPGICQRHASGNNS